MVDWEAMRRAKLLRVILHTYIVSDHRTQRGITGTHAATGGCEQHLAALSQSGRLLLTFPSQNRPFRVHVAPCRYCDLFQGV